MFDDDTLDEDELNSLINFEELEESLRDDEPEEIPKDLIDILSEEGSELIILEENDEGTD